MTQQVEYTGPNGETYLGIMWFSYRTFPGQAVNGALDKARDAWRKSTRPQSEWPAWVTT